MDKYVTENKKKIDDTSDIIIPNMREQKLMMSVKHAPPMERGGE